MVNDLHPFGLQYISSCINAQQFSQCSGVWWTSVCSYVQACLSLVTIVYAVRIQLHTLMYISRDSFI